MEKTWQIIVDVMRLRLKEGFVCLRRIFGFLTVLCKRVGGRLADKLGSCRLFT